MSQLQQGSDGWGLIGFIREAIEYMAMVDYPYPSNFLKPLPGWPVKVACQSLSTVLSDYKELANAMYNVANLYYNATGTETSFCSPFINPQCSDAATSALSSPLGWPWQACTEMVMPICAQGPPNDLFWDDCNGNWTADEQYQGCAPTFAPLGYTRAMMRPDWIITNYGSNFAASSNIIFSNGYLDPWSGGGWSLKPKTEGSIVSIIIEDGGHHYDLRAANPKDTPSVIRARQLEVIYFQNWIAEHWATTGVDKKTKEKKKNDQHSLFNKYFIANNDNSSNGINKYFIAYNDNSINGINKYGSVYNDNSVNGINKYGSVYNSNSINGRSATRRDAMSNPPLNMTPGWNDPPMLVGGASQGGMRRLYNRRPVDPSIQGNRASSAPSTGLAEHPIVQPSFDHMGFNMMPNSPAMPVSLAGSPLGVERIGGPTMSDSYSPSSRDHYNNFSSLPNAVDLPIQPAYAQRNAMAPVKAAGDVSLNGVQLVAFLVKALALLPNGTTKEGIQLRINQLDEQSRAGRISDGCRLKLNFVVDAIDRGQYDEAWEFQEQLNSLYPTEVTPWNQGIRLLLMELRKMTNRSRIDTI
uniref:Uncharacterized protein n=1 Tax=Plectus sambesii TaxID=2011161 RepID=A0A914WKK3_9BILA